MAGTINYLYDPTQEVYVIAKTLDPSGKCHSNKVPTIEAIRPGKVIQVRVTILVTEMKLEYDVQIEGQSGTTTLEETDVFSDIDVALASLKDRIQGV